VVPLWDKIVLLPLIGTLDSERTQMVMENRLNYLVRSGAEIAIIDIMGVPTVNQPELADCGRCSEDLSTVR